MYFKFHLKIHTKLATLWQHYFFMLIYLGCSKAMGSSQTQRYWPVSISLLKTGKRFLYTSKSFTAIFSQCHSCWPFLWLFGNEVRAYKQGSRQMREERRQAKKGIPLQASLPGNEEVLLIRLSVLILQVTFQPCESSQGTTRPEESVFSSSGRKGVECTEDTRDASSYTGFPSDLCASSSVISP